MKYKIPKGTSVDRYNPRNNDWYIIVTTKNVYYNDEDVIGEFGETTHVQFVVPDPEWPVVEVHLGAVENLTDRK